MIYSQTVKELLEELIDKKVKLEAQISFLEEQELYATLNDDDRTCFWVGFELGDLKDYHERLLIAIDIIGDFMRRETK